MNEVTVSQGAMLPKGNASTMVAQTRALAEAVGAVQAAKAFPRDVVAARDRVLNACMRPRLAEVACYTYTKGRQEVTGPSIHLAKAIAQAWGNIQSGIIELERRANESSALAVAWDLETNYREFKEFQAPHFRYKKQENGTMTAVPLVDGREIYEMVANLGSRRERACLLSVIPGDIVDEAIAQCEQTLKAKFEVTPERIKDMEDKFKEFGVTKEQLEVRVQRRIDTITSAQLINLAKIYNSLKDGMSKAEDWFPKPETGATGPMGEATPPAANTDRMRATLGLKPRNAVQPENPASDGEEAPKGTDTPPKAAKASKAPSRASDAIPSDLPL